MTKENLISYAPLDLPAVYQTSKDVLADSELSDAQKVGLLRQWEYGVREISVAEDEGIAHVGGLDGDALKSQRSKA